ncbi:glycoside hydrolase superfamily [Hyaloraphidium curvatum]|nr:glycoside hydrolase superfamily [Hyaloraphidium curvatum]
MNATVVTIGIPWARCEAVEGKYDFSFMDWYIDRANEAGLKLNLGLFNTNVCGKVQEGSSWEPADSDKVLRYTPKWMAVDQKDKYHRIMVEEWGLQCCVGGPPMCWNNKATLEKEKAYVTKLVEHLKAYDKNRTVCMLQLNNEIYTLQFCEGGGGRKPKEPLDVHCKCQVCPKLSGEYPTGQHLQHTTNAKYTAEIAKAVRAVLPDVPLYVNSPWWPTFAAEIYLKHGEVDLVGCDGVLSSYEPNVLDTIQVEVDLPGGGKKRNVAFASECPTENEKTIANLDVLPYYLLFGRYLGIGALLWESNTIRVLDDPLSVTRFGRALYPLKHAMVPVARARGTEDLLAWYLVRDPASVAAATRDVFGNVIEQPTVEIQAAGANKAEDEDKMVVRLGGKLAEQKGEEVDLVLAPGLEMHVEGCPAGFVVYGPAANGRRSAWIGIQMGKLTFKGWAAKKATIEEGVFELYTDKWVPGKAEKNETISGSELQVDDKAGRRKEDVCVVASGDAKVLRIEFDA